jgi:hypothetical protein
MPTTYEPIATTTLGSAAASITFSSIPATYTDLKVVFTGTVTEVGEVLYYRFNSDSSSNYSITQLYGGGTTAASRRLTSATQLSTSYAYSLQGTNSQMIAFDVFSYANSTTNKTTLGNHAGSNSSTTGGVDLTVGLWRSTAAITSIFLFCSYLTFKTGTTATLYGIKNA